MAQPTYAAVVTGASRGLGLVVARVLAGRGYHLVLVAREETALRDAAAQVRQSGVRVVTVTGDVADASVRRAIAEEAAALGRLRVLVNNASELGGIGPLVGVDIDRVRRVLDVNVAAPIALAALMAPMLADTAGLIVNVSSDAAVGAYPGWGAYGASKAALDLVTRTLAGELRDAGVSVVGVDPGDMRTRMHQEAFPGQDISDRPLPQVTEPFWRWLFDQAPDEISGERFSAQAEVGQWLQPA
jgi:NAD(P)-dependent dehydrogenase (short-subunit alcohol dehydrogenase family)